MVHRQQAESAESVRGRIPSRDLIDDPESPQRFAVGLDCRARWGVSGPAGRFADLLERRSRRRRGRQGADPPMQSALGVSVTYCYCVACVVSL